MKIVTKSAGTRGLGLPKQHPCKLARDATNRVQRALEVFQQIVHVLYANAQSARTNLSI
jgi:hypothetical protein